MQRIKSPFTVVVTAGQLLVPEPVVEVAAPDTSTAPFHPCQSWTEDVSEMAEPPQFIVMVHVPVLVAFVIPEMATEAAIATEPPKVLMLPVHAPESVRVSVDPVDKACPMKVTASPDVTLIV